MLPSKEAVVGRGAVGKYKGSQPAVFDKNLSLTHIQSSSCVLDSLQGTWAQR